MSNAWMLLFLHLIEKSQVYRHVKVRELIIRIQKNIQISTPISKHGQRQTGRTGKSVQKRKEPQGSDQNDRGTHGSHTKHLCGGNSRHSGSMPKLGS